MSSGHWIKPARRTSAPTRLAAVVVDTRPLGETSRSGRTALGFARAAVATAEFRSGRWGSKSRALLTTGPALHDWLEEWGRERAGNWVVSPQAGASLFTSGWFSRIVERGVKWNGTGGFAPEGTTPAGPGRQSASSLPPPHGAGRGSPSTASDNYSVSTLVLGSKVNIAKFTTRGKRFTWVSGQQFFPVGEESLAESFAFRDESDPRVVNPGDVILRSPGWRAALWLHVFAELCDWWRAADGGPFSTTPGGMSLNYVRKRLAPRTLLSHRVPAARATEEAALFGGAARTFCYAPIRNPVEGGAVMTGDKLANAFRTVAGPIELWDVRSMYPTILRHESFPVRLLHRWTRPSVRELREMLDVWGVIANVRLKTESPEYPYRDGDRVSYPKGEFHTCLCGPELKRAVDDGAVSAVAHAATYQMGKPFASAFTQLVQEREKARAKARPAWEVFVKLLSNSFSGKLAQRKSRWERRPGVFPERDWGEWTCRNPGTGERSRWRSVSGLSFENVAAPFQGRPLASVFCFLTAHGRYLMRLVREALPDRTVVSQDTDGLWVVGATPELYHTARNVLKGRGYDLARKDESVSQQAVFFGPRHYWTEAGWVLAGFHEHQQWGDGLTFDDSYTFLPIGGASDRPPEWVYHCQRRTRLGEIPVDGTCDSDGWVVPPRLRLTATPD